MPNRLKSLELKIFFSLCDCGMEWRRDTADVARLFCAAFPSLPPVFYTRGEKVNVIVFWFFSSSLPRADGAWSRTSWTAGWSIISWLVLTAVDVAFFWSRGPFKISSACERGEVGGHELIASNYTRTVTHQALSAADVCLRLLKLCSYCWLT